MVISAVADRIPRVIDRLVYLDAFVPGHDQSLHDLIPQEVAARQVSIAESRPDKSLPAIPAALFNVNAADREWVDALCTPQPIATLTQRLRLSGNIDRMQRRMYVRATENPLGEVFEQFDAVVTADPSWVTRKIAAGHDVMIDRPEETAQLILEMADLPG